MWNEQAPGRQGSTEDERAPKPQDGPLSPQELQDADRHCMVESQKILANRLNRGEFKNSQSVYSGSEDIVRVGGRADKGLVS